MDKVVEYRKKFIEVLRRHKGIISRASIRSSDSYFVFDESNDCYTWLRFGWSNKERKEFITVFIHIREGKIWIEEDMTEQGIATELVELGVPKEDIVLAFHPPEMRQYTEFAAT